MTMEAALSDRAAPDREIRIGAALIGVFLLLFVLWGSLARLDAAVYAPGVLSAGQMRKTVQHREGGIVSQILVREGQPVRAGQVLIRLKGEDVVADERALTAQYLLLLAQRARLHAEALGETGFAAPPEFAALPAEDRAMADDALRLQRGELTARAAVLRSQIASLSARASRSRAQGSGYADQATAAADQRKLIDDELNALQPLADKGFVSKSRIRELQRERASLIGQKGEMDSAVVGAGRDSADNQLQIAQAREGYRERAMSDLRDADTAMGELLPKLEEAREKLALTEIRAPVDGRVVGLAVSTVGGVIAPGEKLMDVVPGDASLHVEARVQPQDIDDLAQGQTARVRFTGLGSRNTPDVTGTITNVSADSLIDEHSGHSYFKAEVTVPPQQMALLNASRSEGFSPKPGMPAEVLVTVHPRTALDYLLEPLIGTFWRSFHDH